MTSGFEQAAVHFIHAYGYWALFVLLALETAMILHFVPSELVVTVAAATLAVDRTQLALVIAVSTLGATAGSLMLYAFARYGGGRFLDRHPRFFGMNAERRVRLESWFRRPAGESLVFFLRLVPFFRAAVSIPAGLARMDGRRFILYSAAGSAVFNAALAYSAYAARTNADLMAQLRDGFAYATSRWPFFLVLALGTAVVIALLYRRRRAYRRAPQLAVRHVMRASAVAALAGGGILLALSVLVPHRTYRAVTWIAVDAGHLAETHGVSELLFLLGLGAAAITLGLIALTVTPYLEALAPAAFRRLGTAGAAAAAWWSARRADEAELRDAGAETAGNGAGAEPPSGGRNVARRTRPLDALYWLYERRLMRQILGRPLPAHIGIIVDGNRRHGRRQGISDPREIYRQGADKLDAVLDWCAELQIAAVTLWVFSTENLKRAPQEVSGILAAIEAKIAALASHPRVSRQQIRVRAIGRLDILPPSLVQTIRAAEAATAAHGALTLTIAVAYGGREEITDAVRALLRERIAAGASWPEAIEAVTPTAIGRYLYTAELPDPDLIIRTSGEIRLSGFMLWQSAHSEFYFTDVMWPALRKVDFLRAIRSYQQRNRRFGR